MNELQDTMNTANSKAASLEAKNVRLEKQCDDLIEALDKDETVEKVEKVKEKSDKRNNSENANSKCKRHDTGRCHFGTNCNYSHVSNIVCKAFSKIGFCSDEERCKDRHPTGVCLQWRRSLCDRGLQCFYQHPEKEYGTFARDDRRVNEEGKRKRSYSNESPPTSKSTKPTESERKSNPDSFLYERMSKLEKELEFQKRKSFVPHPSQPQMYMINPNTAPAPLPTQGWPACATPGGSSMTLGPWGSMMMQEQQMPSMSHYYQANQ